MCLIAFRTPSFSTLPSRSIGFLVAGGARRNVLFPHTPIRRNADPPTRFPSRDSSLESAAKRNCLDTSSQSGKSIYTIHSQNMLKFFSSPLDPDEFMTKLKGFVDEEEIDSDNPTLFSGKRPVIGRFDSHRFKLQRRVGIHWILWWLTPGQWFKPYINGSVTRKNSGSWIELEGGTPIVIKIIWVLALLGLSGLIAGWTVFSYPYDISQNPVHSASNLLTGIILLNLTAGILLLLPFLGWALTRNHLADIVGELKRHLDLQQVE
jgi:hypothetical protein